LLAQHEHRRGNGGAFCRFFSNYKRCAPSRRAVAVGKRFRASLRRIKTCAPLRIARRFAPAAARIRGHHYALAVPAAPLFCAPHLTRVCARIAAQQRRGIRRAWRRKKIIEEEKPGDVSLVNDRGGVQALSARIRLATLVACAALC